MKQPIRTHSRTCSGRRPPAPAPRTSLVLAGLALAGLLLLPLSCSPQPGSPATGSLCLYLDSTARTVLPTDSTAWTIASWDISGTGPDAASFAVTSLVPAAGGHTQAGLLTGDWTILFQGRNALGHVIATQTLAALIEADSTTSLVVNPPRSSGDGTLGLSITWDTAQAYDTVAGTIQRQDSPAAATAFSLVLAGDGLSASGSSTLPAGDYLVNLSLSAGGTVLDSFMEVFQVYAGYTSSGSFDRSPLPPATDSWVASDAQPVHPVDFSNGSPLSLSISGLSGKSLYLVKLNNTDAAQTAVTTGTVASRRETLAWTSPVRLTPGPTRPAGNKRPEPASGAGAILRRDHPGATAFNANPPPRRPSPASRASQRTITYGSDPGLSLGATRNFWVENNTGAWISIPASLQAIGSHCLVWVADANLAASSGSGTDNLLLATQLAALATRFDGSLADGSDGIFKNVTNIFGYEQGGGTGGDGGLDADQHVVMLVYDIDYDYYAGQTGGVLGYFWSKDEYTQQELDAWGANYKSNEAELFYLDAHFADLYPNVIASTLIHEYQHMISFNTKGGTAAWFNELCSMVAEDLVCANVGLDPVADGAISRFGAWNRHYAESGVTDWLSGNDVLKSYASAFAFGAWLERNFGGATLFQSIASNAMRDAAAITAGLASLGYSETFDSALRRYGEAHVFTDTPPGSGVTSFKKTVSATVGGIAYTASSVDLDDFNQEDLSSGQTGSTGLRVYDTADAVDLRPRGLVVQSRTAWQSPGDSLTLQLTAPAASGVTLYLMAK